MPFEPEIPTKASLVAQATADIEGALGVEVPLVDSSVEYVLATNNATLASGNYVALRHVAKQIVPSAGNDDDVLDLHALNWLGNDDGRRDAAPATLTLVGTGVTSTVLPAGTQFQRSSDSAPFATLEELVFETDDIVVVSTAAEPGDPGWGDDGNTVAGATFTLVDEVVGLDAEWTVDGTPSDGRIGGGADQETSAALAERINFRAQNPPRGGKLADFVAWTTEVSGVGRAWAYAGLAGAGTVSVFFTRDAEDNPVPDAALVANVQDYLDIEAPAQAGAVTAYAIVLNKIDVTIALTPNTLDVQDAIRTDLNEAFGQRGVAGTGSNYFRRSWLTEAISVAAGETDHDMTEPADDVLLAAGELPALGALTFSTKSD